MRKARTQVRSYGRRAAGGKLVSVRAYSQERQAGVGEPATKALPGDVDDATTAAIEHVRSLTPECIAVIHAGVQELAANAVGFSVGDGIIAHALARQDALLPKEALLGFRLVMKYRRQIPDIYERIFG